MKTLIRKGKKYIKIPKRFLLSKKKRRLHIRTPWGVTIKTVDKDMFQEKSVNYFRSKELGQKPYIPEGFIELDRERFKVKDEK